jgi:VWFA-related protein
MHKRSSWRAVAMAAVLAGALAGARAGSPAWAAPPAQAQEQAAAAFGERIEVELVGVEVWVAGRDGRPVHGLTADDFTVRHDGEPVEITHFSEVRSGEAVAGPTEAVAAAEGAGSQAEAVEPVPADPGHLVLYFDQLRLDPGGYRGVIEGVRRALADRALPAERIMVLRQDAGLHLEAPFGSPAGEIEAALQRVAGGSHAGLAAAAELQQAQDAILAAWEQSESLSGSGQAGLNAAPPAGGGGDAGGGTGFGGGPRSAVGSSGGSSGSILPSACDLFHQRAQPIVNAWIRDRGSRVATTLANLSGTAGFLSGLPGVKTLLYVSDGLDVEPGAALAGYVSDFCPTRSREQELQSMAEGLARDFDALAGRFNAYRVTIDAIQGSGLQGAMTGHASERGTSAPAGSRMRFESRQRQGDRSGMSLLAEETGGRAVFNQNDLADELAAIGRDLGDYYSLAYPPPPGAGGAPSRIEVKLRDRSLTARWRHGYRAPDPDQRIADRLAGALHLGITSNPHEVRLGMGERTGDDAPLRLYAMVPVERLVFLPAEGGEMAQLELRASVLSPEATMPEEVERTFRLRKPPGAADERVSLPLELRLGPGTHRVAVALRDLATGEASVVTTTVEVGR